MKYQIRNITPEMNCMIGGCPSSYEAKRGGKKVYLIIGKVVNPSEAGLAEKVREGEALIEVPRALIDKRTK